MATPINQPTISPPRASLMGLPAELRAWIWGYALFHFQTDGIISPLPDRTRSSGHLLVNGKRYKFNDLDIAPRASVKGPQMSSTSKSERTAALRVYRKTAAARNDHFCQLDCLVPHGLTRASSLIRKEALPVFYQVNHFHFELEHFYLTMPSPNTNSSERHLFDWWRCIGDSYLRCIRHLTLALDVNVKFPSPAQLNWPPRMPGADLHLRSFVIEVVHKKGESIESRTANITDRGDWTIYYKRPFQTLEAAEGQIRDQWIAQLQSTVTLMEANGLSVNLLENVLADLETRDRRFLRNYSELGPNARTHGRVEKARVVQEARKQAKERERKAKEEERLIQDILDREAAEEEGKEEV